MATASTAPPGRATTWRAPTTAASSAKCRPATEFRPSMTSETETKPKPIATPPPLATMRVLTRRASGRSTTLLRSASRRTNGVARRVTRAASANPRISPGSAWTASSDRFIGRFQAQARRPGSSSEPGSLRDRAVTDCPSSVLPETGHREARAQLVHLGGQLGLLGRVVAGHDGGHDRLADQAHLGPTETATGGSRRPDADARGDVGRVFVERNGVLVDGDADLIEEVLGLFARHAEGRDVHEHQVVVGAAGDDTGALFGQGLRQELRVGDRLALVLAVLLGCGELQGHGLGRDDVHQRAALRPGEDALVDGFAQALAAEDQTAARATESLVGSGRDDVSVREWAGVQPRRDEPCDMRHVHEEQCVHAPRNVAEPVEVERAGGGGGG